MKKKIRKPSKKRFFMAVAVLLAALALIVLDRVGVVDFLQFSADRSDAEASEYTYPPDAEFSSSENSLQVYFLDVGQGDCELIRIPESQGYFNILIDSGTAAYRYGLTDFLRSKDIKRLDVVIGTHQHADHMGSLATMIRKFDVGVFYMPEIPENMVPTAVYYETLLDAIKEKGVDSRYIENGTAIEVPAGVSLEVLAPFENSGFEEMNSYSVVLKLSHGDNTFLFTGDSGFDEENQIMEYGCDVSAKVLKVAHHGSADENSLAFLRAVNPEIAVISCGKDNSYGHPHKETIENLALLKAQVVRTDTSGSILLESDGASLKITTGLNSIEGSDS